MLSERILRKALLSLFLLLVSVCGSQAEIGFRYVPAWERFIDPLRNPQKIGLTSAIWDSVRIDTTQRDSSLTDSIALKDVSADSSLQAAQDRGTADTLQVSKEDKKSQRAGAASPETAASGASTTDQQAGTGISASSTAGTGKEGSETQPPAFEAEEQEKEEPPPYRPTIVTFADNPVEFTTELDTSTNYLLFKSELSGAELPFEGAIAPESFIERSVAYSDRESWRRSILNKFPKEKDDGGGLIEISIPVFRSKRLVHIFGGSNIGLQVTGDITVDGSLRTEKRDELDADNPNPTSYQFKVDQTQRFNIRGKVGEKVSVEIDQDSERLFEFENNLRVKYTGYEDEIIQSIEAGNVNLSLPGAKFVSGSGRHQGLFGLKTESKVGPLNIITIASLDKSEKQTKSIKGGAESSGDVRIDPKRFIENKYFFLDYDYREMYKRRTPDLRHVSNESRQVQNYKVYKSVGRGEQTQNAIDAWAIYNPFKEFDPDVIDPDQQHQTALFLELTPGTDYELNPFSGKLWMKRNIDDSDIIAVSYLTADGVQYGMSDPPEDENTPFILKLIKPKNPQPSDSTWHLMFRHVYDLQSTGIDRDGFEGRITIPDAEPRDKETHEFPDGSVESFVQIFGLDHFDESGAPNPDDRIDDVFIDYAKGELEFPSLRPFAVDTTDVWSIVVSGEEDRPQRNKIFTEDKSALDSLQGSEIYDETESYLRNYSSKFDIIVEYENVSATYDLGFMVLEGSEEVTLNGQRLNRGTDYNIDYISGTLTILKRDALSPDARVEIKWESGQLMQLDTKTVLGIRAEYELWDDSYIGSTMMYRSESTADQRIRLGGEPIKNTIWDVNASLKFKPHFLTRAVDWLPLIETNSPSSFTIEGEIAQIYPNPNNFNSPSTGDDNGVAYVDDFEAIKRTVPLGISRKLWSASSFPDSVDSRGTGSWRRQRGRLAWYNPHQQVRITDIWPEKEVQAQASKTNVLELKFQPWWNDWGERVQYNGDLIDPSESWGGVMRYLGAGFADQSQSKYIEIWMQNIGGTVGTVYIDLGLISEDVIPNDSLNTEDRPTGSLQYGNEVLDSDEDTGIDGIGGDDPNDEIDVNKNGVLLPSFDDFNYDYRNDPDNYTQINGTEGNRHDEGGHYPDTEDLSGDIYLDQVNSYFRYKIDLSKGNDNKYIAGGLDNPNGWRLYRIPLADTIIVGDPSMTSIESVRIWLTNFASEARVRIAQIEIVGNEWQEIKEGKNDDIEPLSVAVVNTHDNPEYNPPPGVRGELDPVTQLRSKEQSLALKIKRLHTGEVGRVHKHLPRKIDLLNYRYLKMFVNGGNLVDRLGREQDLEFFFRFGSDTSRNYYEYSQRLLPGWDRENEIVIDLERLAAVKFIREQDSLKNYDILPNGDVMRVVGNPSLGEIKDFLVGIKNHGHEITEADESEIWVDELRVSDVYQETGWAARGSMDLDIADFMSVSAELSQQDANFHRVDQKSSSSSNNEELEGRVQAKMNLDKFFNPNWGLRIPVSTQFRQEVSVPKYKPGSDIKLSALGGDQIDVYSIFSESVFNNDRFSDRQSIVQPVDSLISIDKDYSINVSLSKNKKSDSPFLKYTLDNTSLSYNHSEDYSTDYRTLYKKGRQNKGSVSYDFSFEEPVSISWLKWAKSIPVLNKVSESQLRPIPHSFALDASGTETYDVSKSRTGRVTIRDPIVVDRGFSASWKPLEMLDLSLRQQIDADRISEDSLRTYIAEQHVDLDSSKYWIDNPEDTMLVFDQEAWDKAFAEETERIENEMFWNFFGLYLVDNGLSQSFSASIRPNIVGWLQTDANYSASYRWSWSQTYSPGDRNVSSNSSLSTSLTLGLQQLLGRWLQPAGKGKGDLPGGKSGGFQDDPFGGEDPFGYEDPFDKNKTQDKPYGDDGFDPYEKDMEKKGIDSQPFNKPQNLPDDSDSFLAQTDSTMKDTTKSDTTGKVEKEKKPIDPLMPIKEILRRIRDLRWQYTISHDRRNNSVERGQASWAYRLGLSPDPGLGKAPGDWYTSDSYSRRDEHTFSSGLEIVRSLRLSSISYDISQSKTVTIDVSESGANSHTAFHYFADDVKVQELPLVNWSASWSGLSDLEFVKKFANSITLENSFRGSKSENWRAEKDTSGVLRRRTTRVEYDNSFSPLLGITVNWLHGISSNARYNFTQRVTDDRTSRGTITRNTNRSVNVSGSYTARQGFKIPLPFWPFNNARLKNSTSFSMNFTYSKEKSETSAEGNPFDINNDGKSWLISPSVEYSFSSTVRGGFSYEYGVRESNRAPNVKSQDFSFRVNISIRG